MTNMMRYDYDKNSLSVGLNIRKKELYVKQKGPQDMKEDFRPLLQITITKGLHHGRNLLVNDFRKKSASNLAVFEMSNTGFGRNVPRPALAG